MEDYKKKYEQAMLRMNKWVEGSEIIDPKEVAEFVFLELKESEDERVRKELIDYCHERLNTTYGALPNIETIKRWLAWLEKQGVQKPTLPKWKYKKDNTPLLRDSIILNKYGCVAKSPSGAIVSDVWVINYDELAKLPKEDTKKQGEQKPADKVEPKFKIGDKIVEKAFDECYDGIIKEIKNGKYFFENGDCVDIKEQDLWQLVEDIPEVNSEKQDKQKSTDKVKPKFKVGDKVIIHCDAKREQSCHKIYDSKEGVIDCIYSLVNNPWGNIGVVLPNKCSNTFWESELELKDKQKPAWSEEDEKKIELLIAILEVNHPNGQFKVNPINTLNMEAMSTEEIVDWLKSLKERMKEE